MIDPSKMDKSPKPSSFDNTNPNNLVVPNNEAVQHPVHQHKTAPHYYPLIHQHPQMKNHPHQMQSPLLLNINNQQMIHSTAHRHFQHYPQYGVNVNSNEYSHQHISKPNIATNQQNTVQIATVQQNNYVTDEKQEQVQAKATISKSKVKEAEKKQLRSPSARRPPNAPVAMQGWLHKQGSEGFMLWKKRWFVLSEYCLFYYKGSQEEKLLGSILLPSYKVSVCGPEDKVNRKFAFKCEHANMRTYILAADSHELMMQWVHILNLACNLQNNIEVASEFQRSQNNEPVALKSVSNQNTASNKANNNPVHVHSSSNTTDLSNSSQQELNQYNQPLYANAPPKPRRLTDGYCSPGLEVFERYPNYVGPSGGTKSPSSSYGRQIEQQNNRPDLQIYGERIFLGPQNVDRRTPDTYGRSNLTKYRNPSDYEDIYAEQSAYKRPLSPVASDNLIKKGYPTVNLGYPMKGYAPPPVEMLRPHYPDPIQMRKPPVQAISRPHSADFLEYKPNKLEPSPSNIAVSQQTRPKSSLDINISSKDCDTATPRTNFVDRERNRDNDYFYSQERYAEKMRKSAQYLQKMPIKYQPVDPSHRKHRERYDVDLPNAYGYNYPFREPTETSVNIQPVRSRSALSEGSLLCAQDIENESLNRECAMSHEQHMNHNIRNVNQEQFIRSASARLSQSNREDSNLEENVNRMEGERKREESMKRLLEWKQRMLQSPLNRKSHTQHYRGYPVGKENIYNYQNYAVDRKQKKTVVPNKKTVHNMVQYNSYSSDDEDNGERSSKTSMHSQAGLTMDTFPNNSDSHTHAPFTSTTTLELSEEPAASSTILTETSKSDDCHFQMSCIGDSDFNETTVTTDIKSSGALVKAILSEFQNPSPEETSILEGNYMPMSPKKSILQSRSDTNSDVTVTFNDPEENHYVEMTRAVDSSLMESNETDKNDQQQYEMVCFGEGRSEPVYMEVPGLKNQNEIQDNEELPDILKSPVNQHNKDDKSDSSDADDEASKDLESLENPNQHRFSLSDTFRPASYYLGVSKIIPEFQDSSDSELVSPPPIPTSSPPLDDDDYIPTIRSKNEHFVPTLQNRNSDQYFNSNNRSKKSPTKESREKFDANTSFMSLKDFKDHEVPTMSYRDLEQSISMSRLSSNSDSMAELSIANKRRPLSDDYGTPTEYGKIEDITGVKKYFENLKLEEESDDAEKEGDVPAYENFLVGKQVVSQDASFSEAQINSALKKHAVSSSPVADFRPRGRPESSCSVSAEISSFLANSNRSTPVVSTVDLSGSQIDIPQIAPYYYSDLSGNMSSLEASSTLNNQRESTNGSKKDITRIINPIKDTTQGETSCREESPSTLAAEARSVSVDFLNLTDKSDNIDKKNIYESDTLKRQKIEFQNLDIHPVSRNVYVHRKSDKFDEIDLRTEKFVRKSYSLEGLLENVLNENIASEQSSRERATTATEHNTASEGSYLWEEDSIWREQLRSVSQRHTKSMDDLDCIEIDQEISQKKPPRAITREVTYVNDILFKPSEVVNKKMSKTAKAEVKKKGSFLIDRETLRQWDLLSSAPSDDQLLKIAGAQVPQSQMVVDLGEGSSDTGDNGNNPETASGSISINPRESTLQRDTFPRAMAPKRSITPNSSSNLQARSITNIDRAIYKPDKNSYPTWINPQQYMYEREQDFRTSQNELATKNKMNVSAGELLGRTHEELVLLLIQLRRQQAQTFQAIENCYDEIEILQIDMHANMDHMQRMENLQKLERIKQNLLELEKQYEKRKPLVNLVDNMVKLGSLYRNPNERNDMTRHIRERLEFNQHIQERRLLAEEKRDWNRIEPSHVQLQEKVRQLYQLDGLIQEESRNLHNLQRDKEDIERALGGLRNRLVKGLNNPEEIEQARRQQFVLENELSRVHLMLAQNSKKLEETVAGNARLEQELLVLKQKLQSSRHQRSSPQFSNAGDSLPYLSGTSQVLETDLEKVQKKIGDLQKQREELSLQVRQLTDRSTTPHSHQNLHQSHPDNQSVNKKKPTSFWRETDLDTMNYIDHGYESYSSSSTTPLYINTDIKSMGTGDFAERNMKTSDSTSDDTALSSNQLEKQEIKTVRIVKRESERRQRDREKTFNGKCDPLVEEDDSSQGSSVLFRPTSLPQKLPFEQQHHSLPTRTSHQKPAELSPVFKSEAARQIITEVSKKGPTVQGQRRAVPKERRRHHTAPHDNLVGLGSLDGRRARDDLDIERALRQRIDAPDIVRSTLSNKELKYNEETIDNILSTPNKILIPERYIPEQLPQPSAEEQEKRKKKVESIKKMLSDTAIISTPATTSHTADDKSVDKKPNTSAKSASTSSILEEKKQREHLLQLNQILAKQVMEISKVVAAKNLAKLQLNPQPISTEEEDSSPVTPLPLYQQRENFYS
ncbi:pleckstrin homology domain-containing family A member kramer isoform X3 [Rhynchophorus ferrugineus]|uniref:pleckstrin homology domain-containing family A member kramer isoform X3 n=1 Tax=Rhynchophorus ferrugineus TaxID=354439 RepID=UPI003FCE346F